MCNYVIVAEQPDLATIAAWFTKRLPGTWFNGPAAVTLIPGGLQVVGALPEVEMGSEPDAALRAAAAAGRIARFREDTRPERVAIAEEAEAQFGLPVTWGATCGEASLLFTPGGESAGAGPAWGRRGALVRV